MVRTLRMPIFSCTLMHSVSRVIGFMLQNHPFTRPAASQPGHRVFPDSRLISGLLHGTRHNIERLIFGSSAGRLRSSEPVSSEPNIAWNSRQHLDDPMRGVNTPVRDASFLGCRQTLQLCRSAAHTWHQVRPKSMPAGLGAAREVQKAT